MLPVNTNAAGYEVTAVIAEGNGQAVPLGFIFTAATDGTAARGAKKRVLISFFKHFRKRCPNIKFTLSDKERAEVDAAREVWKEAKHQCCYWHAIRYVETRLAENKAPGRYDPRDAARRFPTIIDPTWAPGVVGDAEDALNDEESGAAHPQTAKAALEELERDKEVRLARYT